jgi:hypothetical protein
MRASDRALNLARTAGRKKRLHVDQHRIRAGLPAVTIQTSAGSIKTTAVTWDGPSSLVHGGPLSCGARVWIETDAPLSFEETDR